MEDINSSATSHLVPCSICGRTFRPDALERHINICKKTTTKKRKVFDSSKQRADGSEVVPVVHPTTKKPQAKHTKRAEEKPKAKSNWRQQHEEFIRAIRAAKNADSGNPDEPQDSESSENQSRIPAGYVPCPSCGRNFSERAADRHIPWCQEQKSRLPKSPASSDASERMKLRTRYRAPIPGKRDFGSKKSPFGSAHSTKDDDNNNNHGDANNNRVGPVLANSLDEKRKAVREAKKPKPPGKRTPTNANIPRNGDAALSVRKVNIVLGKENQGRTGHPIMKFKEKFPNSNYSGIAVDENNEGYMLRNNNTYSRTPRTVPGVRTGGQTNFNEKSNMWRNIRQDNEDDDLNLLQARFEDLGTNFRSLNGDMDTSWAKRLHHWDMSGSGLPQISSSETPNQVNGEKNKQ